MNLCDGQKVRVLDVRYNQSILKRNGDTKVHIVLHDDILAVQRRIDVRELDQGGGYRLTRAPQEYPINEILQLTEGSLAPVACLECGAEACKRAPECRTLPMWTELDRLINGYLEKITLADLMKK